MAMRIVALFVALALAASAFGQQKPEVVPRDTGGDLLWKKLETRVEEIASRLDGVMGVAILDLTGGRIPFAQCGPRFSRRQFNQNRDLARIVSAGSGSARGSQRES